MIIILFLADHPNAEVHLQCGSKEKIGVPASAISNLSPTVSTSSNHGWSRLAYNNPRNPTTTINDHIMRMRLQFTTPRSYFDQRNSSK